MIGLSPLSTGHPPSFQPRWVRPSTGSYPRFSLPMDSSPGFASTDSLAHSTKGTPSHSKVLRLLVGTRFQVLFHSPPGVLFTFPSRYWSTIGHRRVFRLGGWSPLLPTGFHVSGSTRVPVGSPSRFAYGALTLCRRPSQAVPLRVGFVTARRPAPQPRRRLRNRRFGLGPRSLATTRGISFDFSSSGYLDVSVPRVTSSQPMCSAGGSRR